MLQLCKMNVLMLRERERELRQRRSIFIPASLFPAWTENRRDPSHWEGREGGTDMLFNHLQHWLASISADCQNTVSNIRNKQTN